MADVLAETSAREPGAAAPARERSRSHTLAYAALALGALALGVSALLVRWAAAPGPVTGFYRMALASLVMAPFALRSRNGAPWPAAGKRLALLGGLALAFDLALWNTAVNVTTAANATLFANTAPLWVAIGAWLLLRERLRPLFWAGLALTLAGVTAVAGGDFLSHAALGWGDLLALGASFFYAGYYLITQRGRRHLSPLPYVWMAGTVSTAALLVMCLVLGLPLFGYPPSTYLAFFALALVTQVTGYLAVGYALGHLPASIVSPTMVSQPVITALLAIPFLGELLTPVQWIGGAAVVAGVIVVHRSRNGGRPQGCGGARRSRMLKGVTERCAGGPATPEQEDESHLASVQSWPPLSGNAGTRERPSEHVTRIISAVGHPSGPHGHPINFVSDPMSS